MKLPVKKKNNGKLFTKLSDYIVLLVLLLNISFTIAVLDIFSKVGSEPAALIVAFFGFTTGELWALAMIRINKDKVGTKKEDPEDGQD